MNRRDLILGILTLGAATALDTRATAEATRHPDGLRPGRSGSAAATGRLQGTAGHAGLGGSRNLTIDIRWTAGDVARAAAFAKELVSLQPDVILTNTTPSTAAVQRETKTIPFMFVHRKLIIERTARDKIPATYWVGNIPAEGGLVSYGVDYLELFRRAAPYVDRILRGAKPADLPVEQPAKFELVINIKAARAMGLSIPPALLLRADRVIE